MDNKVVRKMVLGEVVSQVPDKIKSILDRAEEIKTSVTKKYLECDSDADKACELFAITLAMLDVQEEINAE